jgi:hypothetical protein
MKSKLPTAKGRVIEGLPNTMFIVELHEYRTITDIGLPVSIPEECQRAG